MYKQKSVDFQKQNSDNSSMTYDEAIKHFGTQQKLADALGIWQSAVSGWNGVIPHGRQCQLQLLTGGVLVADSPVKRKKQAA